MKVHETIRYLRQSRGMTQEDLAGLLGVSQQQVAKLEQEDSNPRLSTLKSIAMVLGFKLKVSFD